MNWLKREIELNPAPHRTTIALWKLIAIWIAALGLPWVALKIIGG